MSHHLLTPGPTRVMGIVNVTPDSFSDGGRWFDHAAAIAHARSLVAEGAAIVDVGGESTRPGAERVDAEEELRRVKPVIAELAAAGIAVSVDTTRAEVAAEAVAVGAQLVNDVSGGLADPQMLSVVADLDVPWICMHWRGHAAQMAHNAVYDDVVSEVRDELAARLEAAISAGVDEQRIVLDPGLGFAKTGEHNWQLLGRIGELRSLGRPILIGASRKRFLGDLLADRRGARPPAQRDAATAAVTALVAARGLGVRTHTAAEHRDAIAVADQVHARQRG